MRQLGFLLLVMLIESCAALNCSKETLSPCLALNGVCMSQKEECDGHEATGKAFCNLSDKCKCCFPDNDCSKETLIPCLALTFGKTFCNFCKTFCNLSDKCKCCFPDNGCSEGTLHPCSALNGTCISQDEDCDGNEVTGKEFCNLSDKCKCCFPDNDCRKDIDIGSEMFFTCTEGMNYMAAKAFCEAMDGHLAEELDDPRTVIEKLNNVIGASAYWIGAYRGVDGIFKWNLSGKLLPNDSPCWWSLTPIAGHECPYIVQQTTDPDTKRCMTNLVPCTYSAYNFHPLCQGNIP